MSHFAFAYSAREFRDQVLEKNPDMEVPSLEWIHVHFWPHNPFQNAAASHTGRLQYMPWHSQANYIQIIPLIALFCCHL